MRRSMVWIIAGAALLTVALFSAYDPDSTGSIAVASSSVNAATDPGVASSIGTSEPSALVDSGTRLARDLNRPVAAQAEDGSVTMTLLHNNDGESKLLPNIEGGFPGIARFSRAWVDLGQSSDADILLRVSSGDNFLASREFAAGLARDGQPFYDSIALRGLYEVMALGNHDFDFGPDITARFIAGFRLNETADPVTFVAANIDVSAEPALQALAEQGRVAPSAVFTDPASDLQVGVIGAITPRLPNISSPGDVIVDADVAGAVNAEAASLIEQGVDRIVLVSHLQGLGEDRDLIPLLSGVDIVVAGGGDELLKNDGDTCLADEDAVDSYPLAITDADGTEVPVVTAPGGYRCIGRLEVTFDAEGNVTSYEGSSIGVALDGEAEEFALTRVEEPLAIALAELDATVIAESDVELDGRRTSVRTTATNVGELLANALLAAGQQGAVSESDAPVVAVQNGGGIRNDAVIPAGDITEADTFDIAPFANFVVTGQVPRQQFKDMLEVAVAGLPEAEGTFPQIAGFTMSVDASAPERQVDSDGDCSVIGTAGSRVRSVTLDDGTEIVRDGEVVAGDDIGLATIDFLATGGDCYPLGDLEFTPVGSSYQQALSTFLSNDLGGTISGSDYPAVGTSTTIIGLDDSASEQETDEDDDAATSADADADEDADEDEAAEDDPVDADQSDASELPNTGLDSWLFVILALTVAGGGGLIYVEARRAGRLSLTNRLSATQAWFPPDDD